MYDSVLDNLNRQRDKINDLIANYKSPSPQSPQNDMVIWRVLNENEEVDNLYVQNKTLFINDSMMVLKGVDGSLEKWKVEKIYPVDKKDNDSGISSCLNGKQKTAFGYKWKLKKEV